jgi:hypothetical protein
MVVMDRFFYKLFMRTESIRQRVFPHPIMRVGQSQVTLGREYSQRPPVGHFVAPFV